ncbi:hypothetical protein [Gloeocapsopsis sp. IPPAS B-1203]|nr:hypothetical protein [Gloeocapsopsis sp. IPPAS B-1203]
MALNRAAKDLYLILIVRRLQLTKHSATLLIVKKLASLCQADKHNFCLEA